MGKIHRSNTARTRPIRMRFFRSFVGSGRAGGPSSMTVLEPVGVEAAASLSSSAENLATSCSSWSFWRPVQDPGAAGFALIDSNDTHGARGGFSAGPYHCKREERIDATNRTPGRLVFCAQISLCPRSNGFGYQCLIFLCDATTSRAQMICSRRDWAGMSKGRVRPTTAPLSVTRTIRKLRHALQSGFRSRNDFRNWPINSLYCRSCN